MYILGIGEKYQIYHVGTIICVHADHSEKTTLILSPE